MNDYGDISRDTYRKQDEVAARMSSDPAVWAAIDGLRAAIAELNKRTAAEGTPTAFVLYGPPADVPPLASAPRPIDPEEMCSCGQIYEAHLHPPCLNFTRIEDEQ